MHNNSRDIEKISKAETLQAALRAGEESGIVENYSLAGLLEDLDQEGTGEICSSIASPFAAL
jgi:hypothetical protein